MRQLSLFKSPQLFHGGELASKKRKCLRPLSTKRPLHLTLKAKNPILYKNSRLIRKEIESLSKRFAIRVYSLAIEWNHVHLILKIPARKNYTAFIRALTGILAQKLGKGLWTLLPFSRVLSWGRDFRQTLKYLQKNRDEAAGIRAYEPRRDWYAKFKAG